MKILNAAIVTTVLALGLAGNSMAAPSHSDSYKLKQYQAQTKHQKTKKPSKKVVVKVIKKAVKKAPNKRFVKVVSKKVSKKKVAQRSYRVKPGDTLSRIAKRNHTSVQKLIRLNNLWGNKANNLSVGMKIRIG